MAVPTPPSTKGFTKKTWGTEIILTSEMNRLEEAIDDLHNNDMTFYGNKTFVNDIITEDIIIADSVPVAKGQIYIDTLDVILKSLTDENLEFWDISGSVYNNVEVATINNMVIESHNDRHIGIDDPFGSVTASVTVNLAGNADYDNIVDAVNSLAATGGEIIVNAGDYIINANLGMGDYITIRGIGKVTITGGNTYSIASGDYCMFENIEFLSTNLNIAESMIYKCKFDNDCWMRISNNSFVKECVFTGLHTVTTFIECTGSGVIIEDNIFDNMDIGITFDTPAVCAIIRNNRFKNNGYRAIDTNGADKIVISGNMFVGNFVDAVYGPSTSDYILVTGNYINNPSGGDITLNGVGCLDVNNIV